MKNGFRHIIVIAAILVFSLLFGLLCDFVLTGAEKKKYPLPYKEEILENAEACNIPASLFAAVIRTESGFEASLSGEDGGIGLLQITPGTYEKICGILPDGTTKDPAVLYDPAVNLKSGAHWLQYLYMRYGNWKMALAAFRVGTDRADEWCLDETVTDKNGNFRKIPDKAVASYLSSVEKARAKYESLWGL